MRPILASLALVSLALAGCAGGRDMQRLRPAANPSAVIAAEIGFNQLAQEKGQWTAFRATAADDAVMFVPQPVRAKDWLKGRADPPASVRWQPHQVWSSCDGTIAATRGAWQDGTASGYFITIWQRRADGRYQWVLDSVDTLPMPLDAPEMITAKVADCFQLPPIAQSVPRAAGPLDRLSGSSDDRTLNWTARADPQCGRIISLRLWNGKESEQLFYAAVNPPSADQRPAGGCG